MYTYFHFTNSFCAESIVAQKRLFPASESPNGFGVYAFCYGASCNDGNLPGFLTDPVVVLFGVRREHEEIPYPQMGEVVWKTIPSGEFYKQGRRKGLPKWMSEKEFAREGLPLEWVNVVSLEEMAEWFGLVGFFMDRTDRDWVPGSLAVNRERGYSFPRVKRERHYPIFWELEECRKYPDQEDFWNEHGYVYFKGTVNQRVISGMMDDFGNDFGTSEWNRERIDPTTPAEKEIQYLFWYLSWEEGDDPGRYSIY